MDTQSEKSKLWKSELIAAWIDLNLADFLMQIGVNFNKDFYEVVTTCIHDENPYLGSKWGIFPHSKITQGILHCYPLVISDQQVIWEEWFVADDKIHHHILSNQPFASEQGVWDAPPDDLDHPKQILNKRWHYQNDSDLSPLLFRKVEIL